MNLPPSILNNPNIPPEVISNLQAGRLGSTIFVANLDFKVGWKKLKEVFSIAGTVKRADIKEDKDGKSRGMGTVTFEQAIEAVQAICILIVFSIKYRWSGLIPLYSCCSCYVMSPHLEMEAFAYSRKPCCFLRTRVTHLNWN